MPYIAGAQRLDERERGGFCERAERLGVRDEFRSSSLGEERLDPPKGRGFGYGRGRGAGEDMVGFMCCIVCFCCDSYLLFRKLLHSWIDSASPAAAAVTAA